MARKKITVVGAGHVGAHTALWVATKELGDVVLLDIVEGVPQGKALDLMEAAPVECFDSSVRGTNDYSETAGSDVVIVTAGIPRKPGMSRSDLINTNVGILKSVIENIVKYSPDAHLLIVTNPLDVMVYAAWKLSGFPPQRIMGLSGALDGSRMRSFIAMELGVSMRDVHAMVIGGHADEMVPLKRYATVSGIPVTQLIEADRLSSIMERTKKAGGEIVSLLKTGSAYYAPSAAVAEMCEAIIKDKKRVMPCAAYLSGQYGVEGMFIGVPVVVGAGGAERIIEIDLDQNEKKAFMDSVTAVKGLINDLGIGK
ncbi:MAG TPA: malate dehydrogenase [Deltaproteobacteria bacterium]|nr:MAG: malate dehydrogenase [Deltaproteobacteria bacterium GWA2_55_82]OGQ63616.1 MAG: malate dehydrogenase [Deltaproteobacteria bacterium RIFCSPLOWO2_02_FULL_55_12]OIJ74451.1 MAG: malate dehydrogenase [Deltaproteobacteria bacterium GWC2_55_46]HBG47106.1 malate dehydrogenase [Deltaproteobacteria bacterium]HCY10834.1 malate dehydrogenase [Deltaproteobacteria bacterium]